jgi:hypothetical protein
MKQMLKLRLKLKKEQHQQHRKEEVVHLKSNYIRGTLVGSRAQS